MKRRDREVKVRNESLSIHSSLVTVTTLTGRRREDVVNSLNLSGGKVVVRGIPVGFRLLGDGIRILDSWRLVLDRLF